MVRVMIVTFSKGFKVLAIISLCSFIAACSDYKEVNQISFAIGVALDKEKDGTYKATLQVVNPSNVTSASSTGGQGPAILNYQGQGRTIGEAMWKSFEKLPRPASFPHLEIVVISEEIAKEGLLNALELFDREPDVRLSTAVTVSHNASARSILNALTPLNKIPSNSLISNLENIKKVAGTGQSLTISQIIQYIKDDGQEVAISTVALPKKQKSTGDLSNLEKASPTSPEIDGTAFFKEDKWVTWSKNHEIRPVLIAYNEMKSSYITASFEKQKFVTARLLTVKSKKYTTVKDGIPYLKMDVKGIAEIEEIKGLYTLENDKDLQPIEKCVEEEIKKEIKKMIALTQKYQTDTLGFGKQLSFQHPSQWKNYRKSWSSLYQKAQTEVHVDISIKTAGSRTHSNQFQRGETQ
ncbi:Ger(x)C family spore germination protein [Peribacillus simplex]|uniref:Ger(X)C family spore germination protein n=2 Tax=Peribacillus simplex TaxID=1478 RepID=A0A8B5XV72_9BACI|nr:Ger(x)C family spore germination protein [Peribacillus simplex]